MLFLGVQIRSSSTSEAEYTDVLLNVLVLEVLVLDFLDVLEVRALSEDTIQKKIQKNGIFFTTHTSTDHLKKKKKSSKMMIDD